MGRPLSPCEPVKSQREVCLREGTNTFMKERAAGAADVGFTAVQVVENQVVDGSREEELQ